MPNQPHPNQSVPQRMGKVITMPGVNPNTPPVKQQQAVEVEQKPLKLITHIPLLALVCSVVIAVYVVYANKHPVAPATSIETKTADPAQSVMEMERLLAESKVNESKQFRLQDEALHIVQSDNWSEAEILSVALAWQRYSRDQQKQLRETLWFQLLENGIVQRVERYNDQETLSDENKERQRLLLGLAKNLRINIPSADSREAAATTSKPKPEMDEGQKTVVVQKIDSAVAQSQVPNVLVPQHEIAHASVMPTQAESNQNTNSVHTTSEKSLQSERPTPAQLQQVAVQFVDAYEAGNIAKFTALFTLDASSNNQSSLLAIKKEYEQLFKSTTGRQMFLKDLKWSYSGNKAVGKAGLAVMIVSDAGKKVYRYSGRIQFVVIRQDHEVLISRLFHLLEDAAKS